MIHVIHVCVTYKHNLFMYNNRYTAKVIKYNDILIVVIVPEIRSFKQTKKQTR